MVGVPAIPFPWGLAGLRGELPAADGPQASRTATVDISDFAYHPPTLTIAPGSKVVFSNSSGVAPTATRKGSFTTGRIKAGKSASIRFAAKGTYPYHCTIHPFMRGKVIVE